MAETISSTIIEKGKKCLTIWISKLESYTPLVFAEWRFTRVIEMYTSLEMCLEDQDSYYGAGIINKSIGDISRGRHAGFPLQSVDEDAFEYGPLNAYPFRGLNDHDKNTMWIER